MSLDQFAPEALRLSPRERAVLAATLWESIEDPFATPVETSDEEALLLVDQRDAEIESGAVKAISHEELMKRLRR